MSCDGCLFAGNGVTAQGCMAGTLAPVAADGSTAVVEAPAVRLSVSGASLEQVAGPIMGLLADLAVLLAPMSDEQYIRRDVAYLPGSVGGHVRHVLDHIRAWLSASTAGRLNYDQRHRGTDVETSVSAARVEIAALTSRIADVQPADLHRDVELTVLTHAALEPLRVRTTVAREAAFVVSHTIHHYAIIGALAKALTGTVSSTFGVAPSTLVHLASGSCAR